MKIILAPDSFKESLSAMEVCRAMAVGIRRVVPNAEIIELPLADGGEGTMRVLIHATRGSIHTTDVIGPCGEPVAAEWGILGNDRTGVIEMAQAAGLSLVPPLRRNPLHTTSYGVGQLIRAALDAGVNSLLIGIGGSATTDCGTGMAQALGVNFYQQDNLIHQPLTGELMGAVSRIDVEGLDPRLKNIHVRVACDIDNPLLGNKGAARVFSPQKGASPDDVERLEEHMARIIALIEAVTSPVRDFPGAGAAGGLGAGLKAFLKAELVSGINLLMDALHFDDHLPQTDLILTGEGKIDGQTAMGKTIAGLLSRARKTGVPVAAVAGAITADANALYDMGLAAMFSICDRPLSVDQAVQNADELIANTSERMIRLWMTAKG